ncbi:uncharacterized protein V1516DRAFT_231120 [Lipomyces oligophaga]|uniref:uncharacterized protein n=1 Tax=Lipomyces oligophaga TaxID=45792 RepID=UPI0034CD80C3
MSETAVETAVDIPEISTTANPNGEEVLTPAITTSTSKVPPTLSSITFPAPPPLPSIIVSKDDIKSNIAAYQTLLEAASALRAALEQVAEAGSRFGTALEACADCRGAKTSKDGLSSAAGLQYLAANHHRILAESFPVTFEQPVKEELDSYVELTKEHEEKFQKEAIARTKQLRKTEKQNVKLGKKKQRNLALYREALMDMTSQVDGLERLKYEYFKYSLDITQDISHKILKHATMVVRAEVEMYEGVARKGWSGEGLDDVLAESEDPFQYVPPTTIPELTSEPPHESAIPESVSAETEQPDHEVDQTNEAQPTYEGLGQEWGEGDKE